MRKSNVATAASDIYEALLDLSVDTLSDRRDVGGGFMFADADLVGAPIRAIVSPRNLQQGMVELKSQSPDATPGLPTLVPAASAASTIADRPA